MWKYLPCFSCQNILMPQAGRFGKQHKKYSIGLLCHRTSFRIQQFRMRVDHPGSKLGRRKSKWSYPIMYYSNSSLIIRRYYWNLLWFSLLISASKCELTSLSLLMICLPVNCDIAEFFFCFISWMTLMFHRSMCHRTHFPNKIFWRWKTAILEI